MTVVRAICANGERHTGHLDWWRAGQACIAGRVIQGVVFLDALPSGSGGQVTGPASPTTSAGTDAPAGAPVAASSAGPTGDRTNHNNARARAEQSSLRTTGGSAVKGTDRETRSGLSGCRCGHSRHHHGPYLHCRQAGCLCDQYRPNTNAAALASDGVQTLHPSDK